MVRIVITSKQAATILQEARFDLPNHNGSFMIGDYVDAKIFENLGPITVKERAHYPDENLLIIFCEGTRFLQKFLVESYPDVDCMPSSAQLPPQDWKPL